MERILNDIRSVTCVVAASGSLNRKMADYVCNGVNDQIEIQAAIDALPATGGSIMLLEGIYNITGEIAINKNNTIFGGTGYGTSIRAQVPMENSINVTGWYVTVENMEIHGMGGNAEQARSGGPYFLTRSVRYTGHSVYNLILNAGSNYTVRDCWFMGAPLWSGQNGVTIEGCTFNGNGYHKNIILSGNAAVRIVRSTFESYLGRSIEFPTTATMSNIEIIGNYFESSFVCTEIIYIASAPGTRAATIIGNYDLAHANTATSLRIGFVYDLLATSNRFSNGIIVEYTTPEEWILRSHVANITFRGQTISAVDVMAGNAIVRMGAAPGAGAWLRGDTVWDVTPTAGATPGWVCTTAGTPGTWKAMANLAA